MTSKKLYRVKRKHIRPVTNVLDSECIQIAFKEGYVFVKNRGKDDVFMISTTETKKMLSIERINVEIVEG